MKERMYATEFLFSGLFYGFLFTVAFLFGYSLGVMLGFKKFILPLIIQILTIFPALFCLIGLLFDVIETFKKKRVRGK